jgi:hypothetical protein
MAGKKHLLISIVTRKKMIEEPYGRNILSLFYDKYPLLAPQYANFYEPINKPINNPDEALEYWEDEEFLGRRRNAVVGSWYISPDRIKEGWLTFKYNWRSKIDWFKLFQELMTLTEGYFGYVHVITDTEREPAGAGSAICCFLYGTPGVHLKKGIPNLGWAHYFGEEYVKELDIPLLEKNGFKVQKLGDGYVFQLTDNLSDVIDNYDHFDERRKVMKSLFRPDLFQKYEPYG